MAAYVYKNFRREPFTFEGKGAEFLAKGPLAGANCALLWIIFARD
jgi:hypothetical protein